MAIDRTPFNGLIDDDGSGMVGSVWNKSAIKTVLLDPIDAAIGASGGAPIVQQVTLTGTQHNLALVAGCSVLRCTASAPLTITGMSAGVSGQVLIVEAIGNLQIDFTGQDTNSAALNRFLLPTTGKTSIVGPAGRATFLYDAGAGFWALVDHEQGANIPIPYNAANFFGGAGMTWTVDAGDIAELSYHLRGKILTVAAYIITTTVGGTVAGDLRMNLPAGFTSRSYRVAVGWCTDNGVGQAVLVLATPGNPFVYLYKMSQGAWTAATNNTLMSFTLVLDVT